MAARHGALDRARLLRSGTLGKPPLGACALALCFATTATPPIHTTAVCDACLPGYRLAPDRSACKPCRVGEWSGGTCPDEPSCTPCTSGLTTAAATIAATSASQCSGELVCFEGWRLLQGL